MEPTLGKAVASTHDEEARMATVVTCGKCGATGSTYFGGHDNPMLPHPHFPATGTEGFCELCGGTAQAEVHTSHGGRLNVERIDQKLIHEVAAMIRHPEQEPTDAYNLHLQNLLDENNTGFPDHVRASIRRSREEAVALAERILHFLEASKS